MKLSEIEDIAKTQKETLLLSDSGFRREALDFLPNIESHALIISVVPAWKYLFTVSQS